MKQYLDLLRIIRETGVYKQDRTGTGTYSIFGTQMRFDLSDGSFPLVTTKKTHLKSIIHELLWFLQGDSNIRYLKANGVSIWDEWIKEGTAEYRQSTLKELVNSIKAKGLIDEFIEWNKPYWTTEQKDGYVKFQYPAFQNPNEPTRPDSVYWAHPDYDVMAFKWAEDHGVSTETLTAGELGPVYGTQWRKWPVNQEHVINALIELSCLGAGKFWGNSDGNVIAQRALLKLPGIVHHSGAYLSSGVPYTEWLEMFANSPKDPVSENGGIDQIANVINTLKTNPDSRRIIVSAWNPAEVDQMALPPCHCLFQFYTAPLTTKERLEVAGKEITDKFTTYLLDKYGSLEGVADSAGQDREDHDNFLDSLGVPRRKLSCQLYQRKHNCAFVA